MVHMPSAMLLTLAYVGVAALLLNLNLASPRRGIVKVAAIALVTALYVGAWHGHKGLLGWASDDDLPARFRLHYATVEEPDKRARSPGTIYLWISALGVRPEHRKPRAYRITWNPATAQAVLDALAEVERGIAVEGRAVEPGATGRAHMVEPADSSARADHAGPETAGIEFRGVPTPALPPKF